MQYANDVWELCVLEIKRQVLIAGDTTKADLIAMSSAASELMWLKQLCNDLSLNVYMPYTLWGDNKSANWQATNPVSSDRCKHTRVRHLRVRDVVEMEEIAVDWIGTKLVLADGLTKVLPGPALSDLRDKLHLVDAGPPRKPCGGVS